MGETAWVLWRLYLAWYGTYHLVHPFYWAFVNRYKKEIIWTYLNSFDIVCFVVVQNSLSISCWNPKYQCLNSQAAYSIV